MTNGLPREIDTSPDARFYEELGRQDMSFEHALAELVDNSISASARNIEIHLRPNDDGSSVILKVADDGRGISIDDIATRIMRMGGMGATPGELNEHGFGLKNSLACLTEGARDFTLLTRDQHAVESGNTWIIRGPLRPDMEADSASKEEAKLWDQDISHLDSGTGTRIVTETTVRYLNSILPPRQGHPFEKIYETHSDAVGHIEALVEHLGVFYRPFIDPTHKVFLKHKTSNAQNWKDQQIRAKDVPYDGVPQNETLEVELEGVTHSATYKSGKLNEALRDQRGFKMYYQGNIETQGVDVTYMKRVILPHQLTELFGLARHNSMNNFVGELFLNDPVFHTLNNKTGLDVNDPAVSELVAEVAKHPPPHDPRALTFGEAQLRKRIASTLETADVGSKAQQQVTVWSRVGVEVDIIHDSGRQEIIYEIKNREVQQQDVYQLIMYWDACQQDGHRPNLARLVSPEDEPGWLRHLLRFWNRRKDAGGKAYHIEFKGAHDFTAANPRTAPRVQRRRASAVRRRGRR